MECEHPCDGDDFQFRLKAALKSPSGRYRLHDGSIGTEYQAVQEALSVWQQRKADADTRIAELTERLKTACHYLPAIPL